MMLVPISRINSMVKGRPEVPRKPKRPNRGIGASPEGAKRDSAHTPAVAAPAATDGVGFAEFLPTDAPNGLTGIPRGIHWRATTETTEGSPELDQIAIDHFLDTLTQVALSVASRKLSKEKGEPTC